MNKQEVSALCAAFGPSGREEDVCALIRNITGGLADETRVDALGNLILHKKGTPGKRLMLCAHMDTAGLIVTDVDERGFLRFSAVGELEIALVPGRHVRFKNGQRGVTFFETADKTVAKAVAADMFIDVGANSLAEARRVADIGDMAVFDTPFADLGDRVACAAVSDRLGCAVLIECLRRVRSKHDLFCVFSAQERVGGRGREGRKPGALRPARRGDEDTGAGAGVGGLQHRVGVVRRGRVRELEEEPVVADHGEELAFKVEAVLSEHRTGRHVSGGLEAVQDLGDGAGVGGHEVSQCSHRLRAQVAALADVVVQDHRDALGFSLGIAAVEVLHQGREDHSVGHLAAHHARLHLGGAQEAAHLSLK